MTVHYYGNRVAANFSDEKVRADKEQKAKHPNLFPKEHSEVALGFNPEIHYHAEQCGVCGYTLRYHSSRNCVFCKRDNAAEQYAEVKAEEAKQVEQAEADEGEDWLVGDGHDEKWLDMT